MKRIILAIATFMCISATLALIGGLILAQKPSVVSTCPHKPLLSDRTIYQVHPYQVIVEPWHGRHQVYGVFMLPYGYKPSDFFMVSVEGAGTYCGVVSVAGEMFKGVYAKRGEHLMVGHLNTRTAVWLIAQGKGDQLKHPRNWMLAYYKRR